MKKSLHYFCAIIILSFSQQFISAQYIIITRDSAMHYLAATSEPDPNWLQPGFDDSGWTVDTGIIGFGDDNDDVLVPTNTKSLYLRYKFNVKDKSKWVRASFLADYDDGYIAYLNGKEIIRVNVDDTIKNPAFDQLTNRSHDWEFQRPGKVAVIAYYLDSLLLDTCLVNGENTIAVHVMNDSMNGSDLHFLLYFYNVTNGYYNFYNPEYKYKRQIKLDSTKFPIVIVNTDEFGVPYKDIRVEAKMGIINNGPGKYNKPDEPFTDFDGNIGIALRGESSADFPKQSYRIELHDSVGKDSNVVLLNMPADNDWILFGPFADKAQFRNKLVYDLGRKLGEYEPRSKFCELIFNGEFVGLYCLTETIKRGPNRVDIAKLKTSDISGHDVTGGYILKYDKGASGYQIEYPKEDKIQPEQTAYIDDFMSKYKASLRSNDFRDPDVGFRRYLSDSSLADYMVMTELCRNPDGYLFSFYFYKDREDRDDRLKFGPLWDYDIAFGNTKFQNGNYPNGWQFDWPDVAYKFNITRMLQDVSFVKLFQDRWHDLRQGVLSNDSIFSMIDSLINLIADPVKRNYEVWPVIDESLFYPNYVSTSYDNEIYNLKSWLTQRIQWIDDNIDKIYYPLVLYSDIDQTDMAKKFAMNAYPSPFTNDLRLAVISDKPGNLNIQLINLLGQTVITDAWDIQAGKSEHYIAPELISRLDPGIYIIRVFNQGTLLATQKVVKK